MASEKLKKTKAHTRYKNDEKKTVPGVTTVLGILAKPALVPWANKLGLEGVEVGKFVDKTARIGTLAHEKLAHHLGGEAPDLDAYSAEEDSLSDNALLSYFEWEKNHTLEPMMVEVPMVSEKYQYGGTVDFYGMLDGKPAIIDFKTGKAIYDEYFHQLAAYVQLIEEQGHPIDSVRILRVGRSEDEGFDERVVSRDALQPHWRIFLACLEIYNLRKEIKK